MSWFSKIFWQDTTENKCEIAFNHNAIHTDMSEEVVERCVVDDKFSLLKKLIKEIDNPHELIHKVLAIYTKVKHQRKNILNLVDCYCDRVSKYVSENRPPPRNTIRDNSFGANVCILNSVMLTNDVDFIVHYLKKSKHHTYKYCFTNWCLDSSMTMHAAINLCAPLAAASAMFWNSGSATKEDLEYLANSHHSDYDICQYLTQIKKGIRFAFLYEIIRVAISNKKCGMAVLIMNESPSYTSGFRDEIFTLIVKYGTPQNIVDLCSNQPIIFKSLETVCRNALVRKDVEILRTALKYIKNANPYSFRKMTTTENLLCYACKVDASLEHVSILINEEIRFRQTSDSRSIPFISAIMHQRYDLFTLFIETFDENVSTYMPNIISTGDLKAVQIISSKYNFNWVNASYMFNINPVYVNSLHEKNIITYCGVDPATPKGKERLEMIHFITNKGYDWSKYRTLLHYFTVLPLYYIAILVDELKMEIDYKGELGVTPLQYGLSHGCSFEMVEFLIKKGANPNQIVEFKKDDGYSLLTYCYYRKKSQSIIDLLLQVSDISLQCGKLQRNILMDASCVNDVEFVKKVLAVAPKEKLSDIINAKTTTNFTPLRYPIINNNIELIEVFLQTKLCDFTFSPETYKPNLLFDTIPCPKTIEMLMPYLDPSAVTPTNSNVLYHLISVVTQTPVEEKLPKFKCCGTCHDEIALIECTLIMQKYGLDIMKYRNDGYTVLMHCLKHKLLHYSKFLLEMKDITKIVNIKDSIGQTALHFAAKSDMRLAIDYLINLGLSPFDLNNNLQAPIDLGSQLMRSYIQYQVSQK